MTVRAIDCWVNVNMGAMGRPNYLKEVAENYFRQGEDFFRNYSIEEMLRTMDSLGIEKAILTTDVHRPEEQVLSFAQARPDRFALSCHVDPRKGMKAVRAIEAFTRERNALSWAFRSRSIRAFPGRQCRGSASIPCTWTRCASISRSSSS